MAATRFRLLDALYRFDLLDLIRERVRSGLPYLGVSAGSNVACPTIQTTNDMPIVYPPSFAALGLIPFQINPHYFHGTTFVRDGETYREHFGETRDERLRGVSRDERHASAWPDGRRDIADRK